VLLLNFPAARDIHQLRALLSGTPLCEIHGSTRSALHREGILINFAALKVRQDLEEAAQTPSPLLFDLPMPGTSNDRQDGCSGGDADCCGAYSLANGASPANQTPVAAEESENPSRQLLSWFGATEFLRKKLQNL